jgi:hypothetical protein
MHLWLPRWRGNTNQWYETERIEQGRGKGNSDLLYIHVARAQENVSANQYHVLITSQMSGRVFILFVYTKTQSVVTII